MYGLVPTIYIASFQTVPGLVLATLFFQSAIFHHAAGPLHWFLCLPGQSSLPQANLSWPC